MTADKVYIFFNSRDELLRIDVSKIVYFEADGNYTDIVMVNKLRAAVCMNLGEMEKAIAAQIGDEAKTFMRIGKRFIINMRYVYSINVLKQQLVLSDYDHFAFQVNISKDALKKMKDLMLALENRGVTHVASYIMLSSMQSIIDMKKSADTILESQKARGIETDGNLIVRMKAFFPTLGPILLSAMSGTEEKAIAMDARAFSHEGGHTYLRVLRPIPVWEYIVDALAILVFLGSIVYTVMKIAHVI